MQEKRVESISKVDMSGLRVPMIAVYKSPEDFPGYCVARIYDMDQPTNAIMVKKTLTEIETDIRKSTNMTFTPRGAADVASLVGVWF